MTGLLMALLVASGVPDHRSLQPEGARDRARAHAALRDNAGAVDAHATRAAGAPWDRARLVDALERLLRTGEPRHATHDEGQELDDALKLALASGADAELQALATRASAPIVPWIWRPLSSRTRPGALHVRAERVLSLPWPVDYAADIDARIDGGPWQALFRVRSGSSDTRPISSLPAAARTPGFHTLALRARIRYEALPVALNSRETRELPPVHYGIWGSAAGARDPVRPFFDAAAAVSAATLDAAMPDVPLTSWLRELPQDAREPAALDWRAEWCGMHESLSDEGLVPGDVCVVARRGGPRRGTHAEIWVKAGKLRPDGGAPRWTRAQPSLVGAYVYNGVTRTRASLASVADLLTMPDEEWPIARLVVNAAGISIGSPTIVPNTPTPLRILIANMGDADVHGIGIHVIAASEDDLPAMRRTFVRSIRAGGSIEIETTVTFPARYGVVEVMLVPDHTDIAPRIDDARENHTAVAVVNPRAAPPGYLERVCVKVGRSASSSCPR